MFIALDEKEISILKSYSLGPYSEDIKRVENNILNILKKIEEKTGTVNLVHRRQGSRYRLGTSKSMGYIGG